jgi:flagellar biosynthesis anti-sigma factor FlgM
MKVHNHRDAVELSQLGRSRRGEKAGALGRKSEAGESGLAPDVGGIANVEISGDAKALNAANQAARSEDTDQAKIDRIKALLHSGQYKPDYKKVADKMVNETLLQDLS